MNATRPYEALLETTHPAWPLVQEWVAAATAPVEVLAADPQDAKVALTALQVTTRSPMGAIVHETGGLLIDHGWVRLLGSGHPRLPRSLPSWTREQLSHAHGTPPPYLLVADDALGGSFGLNGGGLPAGLGHVCYFAPDTLAWEDLELGYTDFVRWCLSGKLEAFYDGMRWDGWADEVRDLGGDQAILIYPFTWTRGPSFGERTRDRVPVRELCKLQRDFIAFAT